MESVNLYAVAAKSEADVKSVRKWLNPERRKTMKPAVVRRIAKAAAALGLAEPQEEGEAKK